MPNVFSNYFKDDESKYVRGDEAAIVRSAPAVCNNTADAKAGNLSSGGTVDLEVGRAVLTLGYNTQNDGGDALYRVVVGGTGTEDGILYLNMTNGNQLERLDIGQQVFDTVAAAASAAWLGIGDSVKTEGFTTANDGGGTDYIVVAGGTGTNDGILYINSANGYQLQRQPIEEQVFDTVAQAKAAAWIGIGDPVQTQGYHSPNDGGGADYIVVAGGTGTADGIIIIDMDNGNQANRLPIPIQTFNTISEARAAPWVGLGDVVKTLSNADVAVGGMASYLTVADGTGTADDFYFTDKTDGSSLQYRLMIDDVYNIKQGGALGDGTDATNPIRDVKQSNRVAYYPDGDYPDTRNGEFYLYTGNLNRGTMGRHRYAGGGTVDKITDDGRPIFMIEKIMQRTQANDTTWNSSFDGGCIHTQFKKTGGDTLGVAITGYARDDGGTGGDMIGVHGRGRGTHVDAEIFGGWSYADIAPPLTTDLITEAIGHEIDVKNSTTATPPFNSRTLPPGTLQGEYRGLVVVTADGSHYANTAIDVGAQRSTGSLGWYTGLRLRELGIAPSDTIGQDTAQMRVQGADTDANAYGGITFDYGNLTYGINLNAGGIFRGGKAIDIPTGNGYYVNNIQVVTDQQAAIADSSGGDEQAKINAILAVLRTHGLIAT